MNVLPKDIQQLIFRHVWKMNIQNCHDEIQKKKLVVVDQIIEYFDCEELRDLRWKNIRFTFSSVMQHLLYAKMIDHLHYFCDIQLMHVFGEPDDFEAKWETDTSNIFFNIHQTRLWQEIPDIPKHTNY